LTTSPGARDVQQWAAFGASVRGSAHVREALPNQDAVACRAGASGRWAVTAVADGHGHALAVRADRGAHLAVDIAIEAARSCWEEAGGRAGRFEGAAVAEQLPAAISRTWLASVEREVASSPFAPAELERSGNPEALATHPEIAYGTTLIVAMAVDSSVVACQIGDGDLVAVTASGGLCRLLPVDSRLVGTKTTSLASRTAFDDFRANHVEVEGDAIEVVVSASDGYVNSFSADDGFAAAGRDLWKLIHEIGPSSVEGALVSWLESTSADGTGDDASLAILFDDAAPRGIEQAFDESATVSEGTVQ